MSRKMWFVLILAMVLLISGIASMVYFVHAKYEYNDFVRELTLSFNAATFVNANETHTEPENAIVARTKDEQWIIHPDQYKKVLIYLKYNAVYVPLQSVPEDAALQLTICGEVQIRVQPGETGDTAMIFLDNGRRSFVMRLTHDGLWASLLGHCTKNALPMTE